MSFYMNNGTLEQFIAHNLQHEAIATAAAGSYYHNDGADLTAKSPTDSPIPDLLTTRPTTLAEAIDALNQAKRIFTRHCARVSVGRRVLAHKARDAAGAIFASPNLSSGSLYEQQMVTEWGPKVVELLSCLDLHCRNAGGEWHKMADPVSGPGSVPISISTKRELALFLNLARFVYESHRSINANVHDKVDSDNVVTAASVMSPDDWDGMAALYNQIKAKLLAHQAGAKYHTGTDGPDTKNRPVALDAQTPAGLYDLLTEFKLKWNAHIASTTFHEKADATNALTYNPANRTLATVVAAAQEIFDKMAPHILSAPISHAFRAEA